MSKLDDLHAASEFSARDVLYIAKIWEDEPKLAGKVMKAIKAGENYDPAAQKAVINEWESAIKYFSDLAPVAQNFILENADQLPDDLALMIKKAATYSRLSGNFWTYLSENYSSVPRAVRSELAERADCPRQYKLASGDTPARAAKVAASDKPVRKSRSAKVSDSDEPAPRKSSRRQVSDSDEPAPRKSSRRHAVSDEPAPRKSSRRHVSDADASDVKSTRSVKAVMRKTNRPGKFLR